MKKLLGAMVLTLVMSPAAWAHSLWVNAFPSFAHPPGHAVITLGFGHGAPIDDLLTGDFGTIRVDQYQLIPPKGEARSLPQPDYTRQGPNPFGPGLTVEKGDLGVDKVGFSKDSVKGTYQVAAVSRPAFMTQYVNKEGKTRLAPKPLDQIEDIKQVLFSCKYMSYAKTLFNYQGWTDIKPLGHDLEIIPQGDISNLKTGDSLTVKVRFMGKPLSAQGSDMLFVAAHSKAYAGQDTFSLMSYLINGTAKFRMPAAGQWLLSVYLMKDVNKVPALADLKGKTNLIVYMASFNLNVNP